LTGPSLTKPGTGTTRRWTSAETGSRRAEGIHLSNLGFVAFTLQDYPEAKLYYEQGLALIRADGGASGREGKLLTNLARVALEMGEVEEAARLQSEALETLRSFGVNRNTLEALELGAAVRAAHGDYPDSVRVPGAAEALRRQHHIPLGFVYRKWSPATWTQPAPASARNSSKPCSPKAAE
jgi:tetratricopeptide (TPR) repeat protein